MRLAVPPLSDPGRVDALRATGLLDAPPDESFARFARLVRTTLPVPVALVSLVDAERTFVAAQAGLPEEPADERTQPHTLCAEVAASGRPLVLRDVREDPLRAGDAVVTALGIAGFAGVPLVSEGHVLGALCAIDTHERDWTEDELEILTALAEGVSARMELLATARRAERAAQDRQAILESSLDCIIVMDHEGLVCEWNPAAERTFGWAGHEALGRRLGDLIVPPGLRERHEEGLRRAVESGETRILGRRLRLPALRRDGSVFHAELAITRTEREGSPFFTGTIRDVTDAVNAEEELRAAEHRYRSLIENIPLVTYMNSPDEPFRTLYMSPQVEELLGYTPAEWAERPELATEGIHPDDRVRVAALAREARRDDVPTRSEFRFFDRHGRTVWVLDHTIPLKDADGITIAHQGFLLDITERKELEERLRQSQKMEAIGQLAGGIAHDFNNMLTAIGGYTELLAASLDADDPRAEDVAQIRKASDHAAALTRQLLAFGRKQVLLPQRLDVNDAVRELERMLLRTIGADVRVATSLDHDVAAVEVDPDQLARVVLNIALNARDAMPGGGELRISTGTVERDERAFAAIEIADTGVGIDEETRSRIFEPFFTTKEKGKGTGLGLATAYGIVEQSGGRIEVDSAPGEGATFRVLLPAAA